MQLSCFVLELKQVLWGPKVGPVMTSHKPL